MDVSNSTGEGTGYRVVGSGGGAAPDQLPQEGKSKKGKKGALLPNPFLKILGEGDLEPNMFVSLDVTHDKEVEVQFLDKSGKVIARQEIPAGKCKDVLVSLVPNGRGSKASLCHRKA